MVVPSTIAVRATSIASELVLVPIRSLPSVRPMPKTVESVTMTVDNYRG
jgi:hypothetical protein